MTFLPIVERELRVAARRRGTYRARMINAFVAALVFAVCLLASLVDHSISFVKILFWGLSGLCMIPCLAAGRMTTADCLSREKREGTLGLLFLTDLKGYDVVLGKLAATSMNGFYGLLAVFPLLAIPLLAGGMTSGEFWRMVLVLVNTFLFSAAVGLFVSSVSRDERKAMGANFALLLWLAALPPALAGALMASIPRFRIDDHLFYSCPVYSFWKCADVNYKLSPHNFWWSIGVTFCLTLLLLLLACWMAPRSWQDKPVSGRSRRTKGERRRRWWREGGMEKAAAFRKRLLDQNAYSWLAARPYLKASYVWMALGLLACFWAFTSLSVGGIEEEANVIFALLLNAMFKTWIATEAGRQLAEDKKSGAFELLLSTPLTVRDIVRGQWLALRRQFLKPLAVAVLLELALMVSFRHKPEQDQPQIWCLWLAGILMLVADAITLGWLAMSASLTAKTHGRATIKTAACILVLPWMLYAGLEMAAHLFMFLFSRQSWDPGWPFDLGCWFGAGIFLDILFTLKARRWLQTQFRQFVVEPAAPRRRFAWLRDWRAGGPDRKTVLRAKFRRMANATVAVLAVGAALVLYDLHVARAKFPKPLVISIGQSNNPVRVFSPRAIQDGFLFILPDGTLWNWGRNAIVAPPRQIGTNRDWAQVSLHNSALGLRSNGTLWNWTVDSEQPQQFGSNHDWVEICAGDTRSFARKRDGTLWAWGNNNDGQLGIGPGPNRLEPVQVGTNRDWQAVGFTPDLNWNNGIVLALRANGTLWTWGDTSIFTNNNFISTNHPFPIQVCRESNWIGLNGTLACDVRTQAGELWSLSPLTSPPGAAVPIASIGHLLSSNAAMTVFGPLFTSNWSYAKYELRTDGTLWTTPWSGTAWPWPPVLAAPLTPPLRFGQRSDWVSAWGNYQTMIGLTSDGTMWNWGLDYGQESTWISLLGERLGMIRDFVKMVFGGATDVNSGYISDQFPPQKVPRRLLKLVFTNSTAGHSFSP